ncbi:MAG TPA: hypothetical protein VMT51_02190 [Dongiaceae bacterium]|nr:hypothetical protein [Dongiaceae bacterium]
MKRVSFFLAVVVLCLAGPAFLRAEDNPILGTWKLNLEKSKFAGVAAPKSLTRVVAADGDRVKYSFEGTAADGSASTYSFTVKYDGVDVPITGNGTPYGADQIAIKRENSHQFTATLKKGGKVVAKSTATVSHDGKTTTVTSKGSDASKPMSVTQVYDKQ